MRRLLVFTLSALCVLAFAAASRAQQAQGPGGYPDRRSVVKL